MRKSNKFDNKVEKWVERNKAIQQKIIEQEV